MTISPLLKVKERIVGPSGIYNIQNEWYGYADEFRYTIGLAGLMGFGVGCCPPELLPDDMAPMPGTKDRFSPNYGTYIHLPSASIMCFLPKHFIDIQGGANTNAPTYGQPIVISNGQTGNAVLARSFRDGGSELAGVFIDKYHPSNCRPDGSGLPNRADASPGGYPDSGGVAASRPLHWPVSTNLGGILRSPFSLCNSTVLNPAATTPANNLGGCWALARSRGADFNPVPIWVYSQLAYLSLAHAQALLGTDGLPISGATSNAAWMDVAPYAPKGSNNNNCADVDKASLRFDRTDITGNVNSGRAGEDHRVFTGAAWIGSVSTPALADTTHNGQLSGIVDLNGNHWECAPGLTNTGGNNAGYRMLADSVGWNTINSNANILSASTVSLIANVSDNGVWWTDANAWIYMIPAIGGTYHPASSWSGEATRQAMTECLLPREPGTSTTQTRTNRFGGDGLVRRHLNDLLPLTGGAWASGAAAGLFTVILNTRSGDGDGGFGARCLRLLSA
jgi:hypothetical protein